MRRTIGRGGWLVVAVVLALAVGCSEPEPSNYALTVTSIEGTTVCGEGPDADGEMCFETDQLEIIDGAGLQLDDCVTVDVDPDNDNAVTRAYWDGRCSTVAIDLGVTERDGVPVVLIPDCLGSFTSMRIVDDDEEFVWSIARNTSTEHPLIEHVDVDTVPPGFTEHDPYQPPDPSETLEVSVSQQLTSLPRATASFSLDELSEEVRAGGETYPTAEAYLDAAGCRAD